MKKIIGNTVGTPMKRSIPTIGEGDEGKALVVKGGKLVFQPVGGGGGDAPSGDCSLPSCDSTNEGQFLRVVDGVAAWTTIPNGDEVSY